MRLQAKRPSASLNRAFLSTPVNKKFHVRRRERRQKKVNVRVRFVAGFEPTGLPALAYEGRIAATRQAH